MGAAAPSGTVTFLFTDIEGSTRLWQDDREAAGDAVRRHDSLMADAVESHGGYVFNTAGDSFAVAFGRAGDALAAAVEAQRGLTDEPWPGPVIRVRMGLHTGEVEERDGDYFGPAANTGARVCAAGHGGQILFTTAVDEIVDTKRVDLGQHRLRDITRPLSLYQVEADGLETEFPPVRGDPAHGSGRRRWMAAAAAAALVVGAVVVALVFAGGDGGGDRAEVEPTATTKLAPTPEVVDTIEVGNGPAGIVEVPGDGSIWVANGFDGTFSRVDPATNEVTDTVNIGSEVAGLEARVGSRLFVLSPEGVIRLINTFNLGVEVAVDLGLGPASSPSLAFGESALWITDTEAGDLVRVGTLSGEVVARIPVGVAPTGVAVGEGAVWVSDGDQAAVVRVNPVTNQVTATIPVSSPGAVVTGHGSVWVNDFEEGTVLRIDPETNEVVAEIPSVARVSFGMHASDDAIWISSFVDNTVSRIDPLTNEVTTTMNVDGQATGLIVADGALWVTNRLRQRVERYEPAS